MRRAALRRAAAVGLGWATLLATTAVARAVDPTASPAPGGDVRTNPAAPGLVGDPLFAVLGVAVVAILAVAVTLLAARLAERR